MISSSKKRKQSNKREEEPLKPFSSEQHGVHIQSSESQRWDYNLENRGTLPL